MLSPCDGSQVHSTGPANPQAVIIDSGSTNRPGFRVTIDVEGRASVAMQDGSVQDIRLPASMGKQLMQDLQAAGPMNELPPAHCVKSISFGSSTHIEFQGQRSPDLSCPAAANVRLLALQKDAHDILEAARKAANIPLSRRMIAVPAPPHQQ